MGACSQSAPAQKDLGNASELEAALNRTPPGYPQQGAGGWGGQSAADCSIQAAADGLPQQRSSVHQVGPVVLHQRRHLPCSECSCLTPAPDPSFSPQLCFSFVYILCEALGMHWGPIRRFLLWTNTRCCSVQSHSSCSVSASVCPYTCAVHGAPPENMSLLQ